MPQRVSVDDTDDAHISYQGTWELVMGSSRQWEMSVHSTLTPGSSATFNFKGYQVWVYGTIPSGDGSNLIDVSIDGGTPTSVTRTSSGLAVYNQTYFSSSILRDGFHQIVVTNRGSAANGNSDFPLDKFEFQTDDEFPSFTSAGSSSSSTDTSASTTVGTISTTRTLPSSSPTGAIDTAASGGKKMPVGAIAGSVIGVLALIVLVLGYLLWRRHKRGGEQMDDSDGKGVSTRRNANARHPYAPDPFPLDGKPPTQTGLDTTLSAATGPGNPLSTVIREGTTEKSGYQNSQAGSSLHSPMSTASSSQALMPIRVASSSTLATSSSNNLSRTLSPNDAYFGHSSLTGQHTETFSSLRAMPKITAAADQGFDHPPPSYSHHNEGGNGSGNVLSYK